MIVITRWEYSQQKLGFQTLSMFNGSSKVLALAVPLDFVSVRSIKRSRLIHKLTILPLTGYLTVNSTQFHLMSYPTVTFTSSKHPFGTIRACEEKLLNLPVGEEFRRAFIFYACAILLAPTSRLNGCRNLWHTIHEDGFEMTLIGPSLCLTNWLRELGDINSLTPLGYMAAFYFYRKYGINIMMQNEQSTNINGALAAAENNVWPYA
ncbi:hypothetical protein CK203_048808 [Vitis vinifera]|uniref:Uncharacterized protein n=1 Tax=Vitis vinifera TaxID=29760 RepID=A0A438GU71_VITVI|nr:hypothetical protein CK203_048808 [Vitis vinifera]